MEGVYFLANDLVSNWATAFLESYREFNPDLLLTLIPFDDRCDRMISLRERYRFDVMDSKEFPALEAIGNHLERGHASYGSHWFRRFAAFNGSYETFMYLDTRIVVLSDLSKLMNAFRVSGLGLAYFDRSLDQVYEPGPWRLECLQRGGGHGFLSGMWLSQRGLFSVADMTQAGQELVERRGEMNPRNTDQFFLNYLCDSRHVRCGPTAALVAGLATSTWARQPGIVRVGGRHVIWDHGGLDHLKTVPLLHWAGLKASPIMPYRRIFLIYALKRLPRWKQRLIQGGWAVAAVPLQIIDSVRRSRFLNPVFHAMRSWFRHMTSRLTGK